MSVSMDIPIDGFILRIEKMSVSISEEALSNLVNGAWKGGLKEGAEKVILFLRRVLEGNEEGVEDIKEIVFREYDTVMNLDYLINVLKERRENEN